MAGDWPVSEKQQSHKQTRTPTSKCVKPVRLFSLSHASMFTMHCDGMRNSTLYSPSTASMHTVTIGKLQAALDSKGYNQTVGEVQTATIELRHLPLSLPHKQAYSLALTPSLAPFGTLFLPSSVSFPPFLPPFLTHALTQLTLSLSHSLTHSLHSTLSLTN